MVLKLTSTVFYVGLAVGGHNTVIYDDLKYFTLFQIVWNYRELKCIKAPHVLV